MLNPFPALLLPFFAPIILRLAIAGIFFYLGLRTLHRGRHLGTIKLPLVGAQPWMPYVAGLAELALGAMFFCGWYTQIAALLGIVGMLKYAAYRRWWPQALAEYIPISPLAALLVGVICFSLLLSGAGAYAFDLPL